MNKPQFIIIGAQKCGTTWLWQQIKEHPETSLPKRNSSKEIYYFSDADLFRKGTEWYYRHFESLDASKVIGEASTHYFYDRLSYNELTVDKSLPVIPELVRNELPDAKILLILRDPVRRFISAYFHHIRYRYYPPSYGLLEAAQRAPKARLAERSYYARYLSLWKKYIPPEQIRCFVFEEDVLQCPAETVANVYSFLGLSPGFKPPSLKKSENRGWTWSHLVLGYYLGSGYRYAYQAFCKLGMESLLKKMNFLKQPQFSHGEIAALRDLFLPEKNELEELLGRSLNIWTYGLE